MNLELDHAVVTFIRANLLWTWELPESFIQFLSSIKKAAKGYDSEIGLRTSGIMVNRVELFKVFQMLGQ